MASSGTKVAPESLESSNSEMGGIHISVLSEEFEGGSGYGAWLSTPSEEHAQTGVGLSAKAAAAAAGAAAGAPKESSLPWGSIDLNTYSPSSSPTSQKGKLPMVLEESESFSHREGSSVWETSSSSKFSNASSSVSSTRAFFRSSTDGDRKQRKAAQKLRKARGERRGEASLVSVLLWPLKKVRDGYMSCMMGLDGAGDLSGLAQGSMYGTSNGFADLPLSKTDARSYG